MRLKYKYKSLIYSHILTMIIIITTITMVNTYRDLSSYVDVMDVILRSHSSWWCWWLLDNSQRRLAILLTLCVNFFSRLVPSPMNKSYIFTYTYIYVNTINMIEQVKWNLVSNRRILMQSLMYVEVLCFYHFPCSFHSYKVNFIVSFYNYLLLLNDFFWNNYL